VRCLVLGSLLVSLVSPLPAFAFDFLPLGDLPGGTFSSEATGVSGDGSIVVGRGTSASGPEAFVWDATNGMRGLGDLAGGIFSSEAWAISDEG